MQYPAQTKLHPCTTCGKSFRDKHYLKTHQKLHSGEKPYKCTVCGKRFIQKSNYKMHAVLHASRRERFSCPHCLFSFSSRTYLNSHIKVVHEQEFNSNLKCVFCPRLCSTTTHLEHHFRSHTGERPYFCSDCPYESTATANLTRHKGLHESTQQKKSVCDLCPKKFRTKNLLTQHIHTHTGELPFKCELCGKTFRHRAKLVRHFVTHTGEKSIGCKICGKKVADSDKLRVHLRSHSDAKPYEYRICGKFFNQPSNRNRCERQHKSRK